MRHRYAFLAMLFPLMLGGSCDPKVSPTVKIKAVTPGEAKTGESLWIRGEALDTPGLYVKLVALGDGAQFSATVTERVWNGIRVTVPSGIGVRRKFKVNIWDGNLLAAATVPGKSPFVFLRSTGSPPAGKHVRLVVIQPEWEFCCTAAGTGCQWPAYSNLSPNYQNIDSDWSDPPFDWYKLVLDQAARDWSTMCSEAWQDPTPHPYRMSPFFSEAFKRERWTWNNWFWLEVAKDWTPEPERPNDYWLGAAAFRVFARGAVPIPYNGKPEMSFGVFEPTSNFRGTLDDGMTMMWVGAFLEDGVQVDPDDPEGIGFVAMAGGSSPSLISDENIGGGITGTDTHGILLFSSSPAKDYFVDPTAGGPNTGVWGPIQPLLDALDACWDREIPGCFPGNGFSHDRTPNMEAHEWWHLFTDAFDPGIFSPLVEDTIAINDNEHYRIGHNLWMEALSRSPRSECLSAWTNDTGKFFTEW